LTTRARLEGKGIQGIADALGLRGLGIEILREHRTGWGRGVTAREIGIMSPITPSTRSGVVCPYLADAKQRALRAAHAGGTKTRFQCSTVRHTEHAIGKQLP
jgi:hypothetical protein